VACVTLLAVLGPGGPAGATITTGDQLSFFAGTGAYGSATPGTAASTPIGYLVSVAADGLGNVFFLNDEYRVEKIDSSGALTHFAGNGSFGTAIPGVATSSPLGNPQQIVADAAGNVYIADFANYQVEKVTTGGTLSVVAGNGSSGTLTAGVATSTSIRPRAVAVDGSGNVYIFDLDHYQVVKVTPGGTLSIIAGTGSYGTPTPGAVATSTPLGSLLGIAVDSSGNVYLTDSNHYVVERINASGGTLSIIAGVMDSAGTPTAGPAASSQLSSGPRQLAIDADDSLYIADTNGRRVEKITTPAGSGTLSIIAGTGAFGLPTAGTATASTMRSPYGVAVDSSDNVFIADFNSWRVLKIAALVTTAPSAPTGLSAAAGNASALLSFGVPASNGGATISGYEYTSDAGATWHLLATSGGGPLTGRVTGLSNGTSYTFGVRAVNSVGSGASSSPASATPVGVPSAPTSLSAASGDASAALSFLAPGSTGGNPINGYRYSSDAGLSWNSLVVSGSDPVTGTVSGLTNGTSYTFVLRAENGVGAGLVSGSVTVTPATTPSAPSSLSAEAHDQSLTLSFGPPASDGGAAISGYEVSADLGASWQPLATSGSDPVTGTVSGLTNGLPYELSVRAVNSVGVGTASESVTATPASEPSAPRQLSAKARNRSVVLTFLVPVSTGGAEITRYQVSTDAGQRWRVLAVLGASTLRGTVAGLTNGRRYTISVRAVNQIGHSPASRTVTAKPGR
jgi:hypothetical protein